MTHSFITFELMDIDIAIDGFDPLTLSVATANDVAEIFSSLRIDNVRCEWEPEQISPTDPTKS